MPEPRNRAEALESWLFYSEGITGKGFVSIDALPQDLLNLLGITQAQWGMHPDDVRWPWHWGWPWNGEGGLFGVIGAALREGPAASDAIRLETMRWFLVRDALFKAYGIEEPLSYETTGKYAMVNRGKSYSQLASQVEEETQYQARAGNTLVMSTAPIPPVYHGEPPTFEEWVTAGYSASTWPGAEGAPSAPGDAYTPVPTVTGKSLGEIGASWLSLMGTTQDGRDALTLLKGGRVTLPPDEIGRLLATLYAGGTETAISDLAALLGEENAAAAEAIALRMQIPTVQDALYDYFVLLGEREVADYILDVADREYQTLAGQTKGNVPTAQEIAKIQFSLINRLWGGSTRETDEALRALTAEDNEVLRRLLNGNMAGVWKEIIAQHPELQDAVANTNFLIDIPDEVSKKLWDTVFTTDSKATLPEKLAELATAEEIWRMQQALATKGMTQPEFDARKDMLIRGGAVSQELWNKYAPVVAPVVPDKTDPLSALTFWGAVRNSLEQQQFARALDATPDEILAIQAAVAGRIAATMNDPVFIDMEGNLIGSIDVTDDATIAALDAKGAEFDDIKAAMFYVASGRVTTTDKRAFGRLAERYFREALGGVLDVMSNDEVLQLALANELLWEEFLAVSAADGAWQGIAFAKDPKAWLAENFAEWIEGVKKAPTQRYGREGEVGQTLEALFEPQLRAIKEAGTSLEVAKSKNLTPAGRVMWGLGSPLLTAEDDAEALFSAFSDETADAYYERVAGILQATARREHLTNPSFVDAYGFLSPTIDAREIVRTYGGKVVPGVVYAAEGLGVTIGEVQRRRDAMMVRATPSASERERALSQALQTPQAMDFVDILTPIISQLPVSQRAQAMENAIMMETQLRAEWEASRPRDEQGELLDDVALRDLENQRAQAQSDMLEEVVRRNVAQQFGITPEEVTRLGTAGAMEDFATGLKEIFARAGEVMPPLDKQPPPQDVEDVMRQQAVPPVEDAAAKAERERAAQIAKAMRETREAFGRGQPFAVGRPRTFEEFMSRQKGTRFAFSTQPTVSPALVTRRVR